MYPIILGIVLLFLPVLLISRFWDMECSFPKALSIAIAFHLLVGIITQALGMFNYQNVLLVTLFFNVVIILTTFMDGRKKSISNLKIDWVLIMVVIVGFISLYSVHYNYSGKYSVVATPEYINAENLKYPYPYYSDEWYAISFIQESIRSENLPINNPLTREKVPFLNFEAVFHSFVSELSLLLGLEPLTGYTKITIATGVLLIVLVYLLLRTLNVSKVLSALSSISVLYITNGANLPGLWNLLPLNIGVLTLLLSFIFLSTNKIRMAFFTGFLTLLFYPPLVIFYTAAFLAKIFLDKSLPTLRKYEYVLDYTAILILSGLIVSSAYALYTSNNTFLTFTGAPQSSTLLFVGVYGILAILVIYFSNTRLKDNHSKRFLYGCLVIMFSLVVSVFIIYWNSLPNSLGPISEAIHYPTFTLGAIPDYAMWYVLPLPVLIFSFIGVYLLARNRSWIFIPIIIGLGFWSVYSLSTSRLIIEYQRVVFVTAVILVISMGIGIQYLIELIRKYKLFSDKKLTALLYTCVFVVVFMLVPQYSEGDKWKKLTLRSVSSDNIYLPAAPANKYLHQDDLKIFSNIHEQNFLSLPWKGTVIGVATDNYPLSTKPGTITMYKGLAQEFITASCGDKYEIVQTYNIDYVYFPEFKCPAFEEIDKSAEGLILYKTK